VVQNVARQKAEDLRGRHKGNSKRCRCKESFLLQCDIPVRSKALAGGSSVIGDSKQKGITDASMQVRESRYCQGHGQYSKKSYRSNLTVGKEDKKGRCKRSEQVRVKSREKERGR
jgi:hypothetical protein